MKIILLLVPLFLIGCASKPVPVTMKFPEAPAQFMEPCPELKKLTNDAKLSDVAKTVIDNYTLYHECSIKSQAWVEWYKANKKIFEDVK